MMTNEQKIKSLNTEQLADFLARVDYDQLIPKKLKCDEFACVNCKEKLSCYTIWLKKEERWEVKK